ncbi:hypothetical protein [Lactiplantibacillus mudanjiangensis]|uniref:Uncharacterized protein n=1 Tax=Lactiplantibacillus mudanjiangensis TaxID=1296538 RepID=A0A660DXT4_9LACO|nr:hypothetical protein [Lactiplantibacillus mudanjiangensis]VDG23704.1 hypothetical protein MUDAN_IGPPGNFN_02242 [Lactiplantibacillus mudanjiangensis]VDG27849.1 hypothetical protein MUDAN_MDHGFNIF_02671 [Lactiplantibacillus mudanjiangensis]
MIGFTILQSPKRLVKRLKYLEKNDGNFEFPDQLVMALLLELVINNSRKEIGEIANSAGMSIHELSQSLLKLRRLGLVDYKTSIL